MQLIEKQKISPEQAHLILGISPNEIRYVMRKEINVPTEKKTLPIGQARKASTCKRGRPSYRYDIYKSLVLKHVGLTEWPEGGERK